MAKSYGSAVPNFLKMSCRVTEGRTRRCVGIWELFLLVFSGNC